MYCGVKVKFDKNLGVKVQGLFESLRPALCKSITATLAELHFPEGPGTSGPQHLLPGTKDPTPTHPSNYNIKIQ